MTDTLAAPAHVSTPETRAQADAELARLRAEYQRVREQWPAIRELKETARREREQNNFGPRYLRALGVKDR